MKISIEGFKAKDRELELSRFNILAGPNGAGKTAIADAIRFLALGHIPSLGKRPKDTAELMAGRKMEVTLTLDDDRILSRVLEQKAKALTTSSRCSWLRNAKPTEHHSAIQEIFGAEEADIAEALDIRILLDATPNMRAARIEELLSSGQTTPSKLAERIAFLTASRLSGIEPSDSVTKQDMIRVLSDAIKLALRNKVSGDLLARLTDSGVAGAATWANEEKRHAEADLDTKRAAKKEIDARLESAPAEAPDLDEMREERDRLQRELGAERERVKQAEERGLEGIALGAQLIEMQNDEKDLKADLDKAKKRKKGAAKERKRREVELAKLEKERKGIRADCDKFRSNDDDVSKLEEKKQILVDGCPMVMDTAEERGRIAILERELEGAESSEWQLILAACTRILAVTKIGPKVTDPTHVIEAIAKKHVDRTPSEISDEMKIEKTKLRKAEMAQRKSKAAASKTLAQVDDLQKVIEAMEKKSAAGRSAAEKRLFEIQYEIDKLCGGDSATELEVVAEQELRDHRKALAEKKGELKALGDTKTAASDRRTDLQDELDKIAGKISDAEAIATRRNELASISAEILGLEAEATVFKAVEWSILRVREEEVEKSGAPLLKSMESFIRDCGIDATPYIRAGKGQCSVGWIRADQREVDVRALSGGEWTAFTAALVVAMFHIRKPALPVLLIEGSELDNRSFILILYAIEKRMPEGGIVIVGVPTDGALDPAEFKGWTVDNLIEKETAV